MTEIHHGRFVCFEELKQAIAIEQVLERYGLRERLRRSGDHLSGACPLHRGHNPTQFRVSLSKNCWICFGDCHCGGSILDLVARMEGIPIHEAGLRLQDWFNLLPRAGQGIGQGQGLTLSSIREKTVRCPPRPNRPLAFTLAPLEPAHPYLKARGLLPETIATFGLGWCPHGSLQGWIAIPIHDAQGRLVAYAGRWPGQPLAGQPKYRLPRGFGKSFELFNQHRAELAPKAAPLVVTEGFFGCLHVWQSGYPRVVALMGSVLSRAQEQRILELAGVGQEVLLFLDGDAAGSKGAAEAATRLNRSVIVQIVPLAEGQQPDDLPAMELRRRLDQARLR